MEGVRRVGGGCEEGGRRLEGGCEEAGRRVGGGWERRLSLHMPSINYVTPTILHFNSILVVVAFLKLYSKCVNKTNSMDNQFTCL